MAVDLLDLVDPLKRALSGPGEDLYPDVTDLQWVGYLADAFWSARIEAGLFSGFGINENDEIENIRGGDDLSRDYQQIIVLYAALGIITNYIRTVNTRFRAKAGPAEFETENSATALRDILSELQRRRDMILGRISDLGFAGNDVVMDLFSTVAMGDESYFVR